MQTNDLLPIIVPGIIIGLFIQGYYIRHCWLNHSLNDRTKIMYVLLIMFFNLPAAAIYLFATNHNSVQNDISDSYEWKNLQVQQGIFVSLVLAFEVVSLRIIFDSSGQRNHQAIILLLGICLILFIINNLLNDYIGRVMKLTIPLIQIVLIVLIDYLGNNLYTQLIVLTITAGIINVHPLSRARIYSLIGLITYTASNTAKIFISSNSGDNSSLILSTYINLLIFILIFASFYYLKKQVITNKNLQNALRKLREQSLKLEELAALSERNKIAGEIHDTVGHQLTTAIIAMESIPLLLDKNSGKAIEKLDVALNQVKESLNSIRNSVKTLKQGEIKKFGDEIREFIDITTQSTGLKINLIDEQKGELLPIHQNILMLSIKECITNSLKHGNSTEADILIQEHQGKLQLTVSDNGTGTDKLIYGFGLVTMRERVESVGGIIRIDSREDEGFTVNISMPIRNSGVNADDNE